MSEHTSFTMRNATANDRDAIETLLTSAALPPAGVAEMIEADASQFVVASAESDPTQLVAVSALEVRHNSALLRSVAVHEAWRGHGLGARIVREAITEAETRKLSGLYLLTTTAATFFHVSDFRTLIVPSFRRRSHQRWSLRARVPRQQPQ